MPSTVVARMQYIPETETLRIVFVSGKIYDYKKVPEKIYKAMKSSGSKGIYLNKYIKGNFDFDIVEDS
ncbi:MAG: ATPase protein [Ferruginibacter sp.]|nr:ATPase protein [Ferruginibacter sp.]